MPITQKQRDINCRDKRAERQRYKDANLTEVTERVPDNHESVTKLRAYAKKLRKG